MIMNASKALDVGSFVVERVSEPRRRLREREDLARVSREAYVDAGGQPDETGTWLWTPHRATWICRDAVVKVARGTYGEWSLRQDESIRSRIHCDPAVRGWSDTVADTRWSGDRDGRYVVVEDRLPGTSLEAAPYDDRGLLDGIADQLAEVHRTTGHLLTADGNRLMTWFCGPAATLSALLERWGHGGPAGDLRTWADRAAEHLGGRLSRVCLVHGDLWPGNVLARDGVVTGLIDWDQAAPHDAALHDILHFALYPTARERRSDLGLLVREALVNDEEEGELGKVMRQPRFEESCRDIGMGSRDALIWYWLRHTARMSAEPGHANNPRWVSRNVVAVASAIKVGRQQ